MVASGSGTGTDGLAGAEGAGDAVGAGAAAACWVVAGAGVGAACWVVAGAGVGDACWVVAGAGVGDACWVVAGAGVGDACWVVAGAGVGDACWVVAGAGVGDACWVVAGAGVGDACWVVAGAGVGDACWVVAGAGVGDACWVVAGASAKQVVAGAELLLEATAKGTGEAASVQGGGWLGGNREESPSWLSGSSFLIGELATLITGVEVSGTVGAGDPYAYRWVVASETWEGCVCKTSMFGWTGLAIAGVKDSTLALGVKAILRGVGPSLSPAKLSVDGCWPNVRVFWRIRCCTSGSDTGTCASPGTNTPAARGSCIGPPPETHKNKGMRYTYTHICIYIYIHTLHIIRWSSLLPCMEICSIEFISDYMVYFMIAINIDIQQYDMIRALNHNDHDQEDS